MRPMADQRAARAWGKDRGKRETGIDPESIVGEFFDWSGNDWRGVGVELGTRNLRGGWIWYVRLV